MDYFLHLVTKLEGHELKSVITGLKLLIKDGDGMDEDFYLRILDICSAELITRVGAPDAMKFLYG